jgi:hypothetical protein
MNLFDYTQKNYWGGPWYPYWTLILATVVFGFFGLDHFWLRSPLSGLIKAVVNVLTLGMWYFYDVIQIATEQERVQKYGLSAPVFGPLGIGAGMFRDNMAEGETLSKSPFRYLLYVIMLLVPFTFGLEYVVAGDRGGAGFKFLTSIFFFILAPVGIIYTLMNFLHAVVIPKSLFEQGTYHLFPASMFIGPRGVAAAGVLGPKDVPEPTEACSAGLGAVFAPFVELAKVALQNITAPATAAVGAVAGAVEAGATAVKTGAEVITQTGKTISSGLAAVEGIASGAGGLVSGVKGAVEGQIQEKLQAAAQGMAQGTVQGANPIVGSAVSSTIGKQLGGSAAGALAGAYEAGAGDWALILLMMGTGAYFLHKKYKEYFVDTPKKTERAEYHGVPIPATSK